MSEGTVSQSDEFTHALRIYSPHYGASLGVEAQEGLSDYYEHVTAWNARLHLVAPCSPIEFATRHVLESLLALPYLTPGARVTDVGSGAGLPIIPCLIVRPDLHAILIEASPKKAVFLREALRRINIEGSAKVIVERFEKTLTPEADFITCRALDRFTEMFARLVAWSPPASQLLLWGGHAIREQIEKSALSHLVIHIPDSDQRFLFVIKNSKVQSH